MAGLSRMRCYYGNDVYFRLFACALASAAPMPTMLSGHDAARRAGAMNTAYWMMRPFSPHRDAARDIDAQLGRRQAEMGRQRSRRYFAAAEISRA